MAQDDKAQVNPLEARILGIVRGLDKRHAAKGERIDNAVRQLQALADDVVKGVEG